MAARVTSTPKVDGAHEDEGQDAYAASSSARNSISSHWVGV